MKSLVTTRTVSDELTRQAKNYQSFAQQLAQEDTIKREAQLAKTQCASTISFEPYQINLGEFEISLGEQFYIGQVMQAAQCVVKSIADSTGFLNGNRAIRHWLIPTSQIGSDSTYGQAIQTNLGYLGNQFVLKYPNKGQESSIIHEYVVGTYGTNKLRGIVPNFAYVLGLFSCSVPILSEDRNVLSWCTKDESNMYIVYENINPSISLSEYIRTCNLEGFLNVMMQLLYSLRTASREIGFTHYDLHLGNVLLRQVDSISGSASASAFAIPYQLEDNSTGYLVTNQIATMIDFGTSFIRIDDQGFGYYGLENYGVMPDRDYPLFDVYKFLLMSLRGLKRRENPIYSRVAKLLQFFNRDESVERVLAAQDKFFYALPWIDQEVTIDDFIRYVRATFPDETKFIKTSRPDVTILDCSGKCPTVDQVLEEWMIGQTVDIITPIINAQLTSIGQSPDVDSDNLLEDLDSEFERKYDKMDDLLDELVPWKPTTNWNRLDILRYKTETLATVVELYFDLDLLMKSLEYIPGNNGLYKQYQNKMRFAQQRLDRIAEGIAEDLRIISKFERDYPDEVERIIQQGSGEAWIWTQFLPLIETLDTILPSR